MTTIFCSGHASLADGTWMLAGGGSIHNGSKETNFFCYGPCLGSVGSGPWRIGPDMASGRWYPTCTTLDDGRVLTVAGTNEEDEPAKIPEIYDPVVGMWETLTEAEKELPLYPFMFLLPDGRVYFAGPSTFNPETEDWETFVLEMTSPESWDDAAPITTDYKAHDGTAVMYEPGKIIRMGGVTAGVTENAVELIDFDDTDPQWSNAPPMKMARVEHQSILLADGTVFTIGGRDAGGAATNKTELYDPATGISTYMADMSYFRYEHSIAILLPDGKVLSAGGNACNPNQQSSDCGFGHSRQCTAEIFAPPYLFAGPQPVIGYAPSTVSYILDFRVSLAGSSLIDSSEIDKISFVRLGAMTHNFDQNQRYVPLNFEIETASTLSVEAPLNGNIAPPGYYMLFLISDAGVPSEAKFVQLQ